jgi:hypothetical protein
MNQFEHNAAAVALLQAAHNQQRATIIGVNTLAQDPRLFISV